MNLGLGKAAKTGLEVLGSPAMAATFAGMRAKQQLEEGKGIADVLTDPLTGVELLFPELSKKTLPGVMSGILGLGRVGKMLTPVGTAMTTVGGLKERAKAMMQEADALTKTPYQEDLIDEYAAKQYRGYESGGRVGFAEGPEDPSKRKFMKIAGGLASLPIVGRFFDIAQVAEKAAPAVVETFKNAPPHFMGLVNKIRALGKIVEPEKLMPSEQKRFSNVYDYGDYRMFESKDGQIEIAKDKFMATDYGDAKVSEEYMSYNPKSPKIGKKGELTGETEPQYDEYTAYADQDGKMKDVVDGVEPNTIDEGTYSKEELEQLIIEQVEQNLKKGKK
jgi:hypothetical protein